MCPTAEQLEEAALQSELNFGPHLPLDRYAPILDAGCGYGHLLHFLTCNGYKDLTGVDDSIERIDWCRDNIHENVFCNDILYFLNDSKQKYDTIIMSSVIEHIKKDRLWSIIRLVREHLSDSGKFLVSTANLSNPFSVRTRYIDQTHQSGFTPESLEQIMYECGLGHIKIYPWRAPSYGNPLKYLIGEIGEFVFDKALKLSYASQRMSVPSTCYQMMLSVASKR